MRTFTLKTVLPLVMACLSLAVSAQQVAKSIPYPASPDGIIGFLEFRPSDYGTQKHPLIIFLHGIGERGNGSTQINNVTANAIPKFCAAGASMRFTVGGVTSSFVVISPQLSVMYGSWPTFYVKEMIKYAKANLQIDTNRIYVTGLSLGGGGIWKVITDNTDYSFDGTIAAAAPVCGTQEETDAEMCNTIAANHLPVWGFHCMDDGTVGVGATQHAEILLSWCTGITPAAKFTYYTTGNHAGAWINAYDTGHITRTVQVGASTTSFTQNPNLYEWFLMQSRTPANVAPVANAGTGGTISLPANSATLNGSGSNDPDGSIVSYAWTKSSGPSTFTIANPAAATTGVSNLVAGTYVFNLQVTDNKGTSANSTVTIVVNPAAVANAGVSQAIFVTSTALNGTGSYSPNGAISSYQWLQVSGSPVTISNANSVNPTVSNMVVGQSYSFQLTVTDVVGASGSAVTDVAVLSGLLPVNLTWFKGESSASGNRLSWETASETNNDFFSLERSGDGKSFQQLAQVTGAGNSTTIKDYSYTDGSPFAGTNYYRLRQVDKDGHPNYSNVVVLAAATTVGDQRFFPNPVNQTLSMTINNDVKGNGAVSVYDLSGHLLHSERISKADRVFNRSIDMSGYAKGLYIVELKLGDSYKTQKTVLKN